jgi:hypothetical protein
MRVLHRRSSASKIKNPHFQKSQNRQSQDRQKNQNRQFSKVCNERQTNFSNSVAAIPPIKNRRDSREAVELLQSKTLLETTMFRNLHISSSRAVLLNEEIWQQKRTLVRWCNQISNCEGTMNQIALAPTVGRANSPIVARSTPPYGPYIAAHWCAWRTFTPPYPKGGA